MNNDELSDYIVRYATTDITKTAILLSGKWGSGKSYFISHDLSKKLKEKKVRYVVVSLYGIDSLKELSKQLYCSLRLPTFSKKSETKKVISIAAHTIINNALSFSGISLDINENDLQKLYESVNLHDVLVIFEDIERSSVDILKLLGFVNGLVEYDGSKVLLVANETELINKELCVKDYKRTKEKTIGDTIVFKPILCNSIKGIIKTHPSPWSKTLLDKKEIDRLVSIVEERCDSNLRLFLYSLQKCNEIFATKQQFDDEFYRATFEGILAISKSFVSSDISEWKGDNNISSELGDSVFPVFKFAYNYLKWHTLNEADVIACAKEYKDYRFFEKNAIRENDEDFNTITNYYIQKEADIITALKNLEKKLEQKDYGGVFVYEILGYYVIKAGTIVGYNTDLILNRMIHNADTMRLGKDYTSTNVIEGVGLGSYENKEVREKYNKFIHDLTVVVELDEIYSFSYKPKDIHKLSKIDRSSFYLNYKFLSYFDIEKLVEMLLRCSSKQIIEFKNILRNYYVDSVSKYNTSPVDCKMIEDLLGRLSEQIENNSSWDCIQKMHIEELIRLLELILSTLKE